MTIGDAELVLGNKAPPEIGVPRAQCQRLGSSKYRARGRGAHVVPHWPDVPVPPEFSAILWQQ